jgi:DNA repair protein RadA/Sms
MSLFGLQPVYDLKERILGGKLAIAGHVLSIAIDNGRPIVITLEALLNKSVGKYPQRVAIGIENNRLSLIVAILEKYLKCKLGMVDIYINIPGEFNFRDSGLDLAVAAAIYSQYKGKVLANDLVFSGEIGL